MLCFLRRFRFFGSSGFWGSFGFKGVRGFGLGGFEDFRVLGFLAWDFWEI